MARGARLATPAEWRMQPGDVIGFSGDSWLSVGITLATYGWPFWSLSHVGIVGPHDGRLVLFESTTLGDLPCLVTGKPCRGVQAQELDGRIETYRGKVWHYPLTTRLYPHQTKRLAEFLHSHLGRPYDDIGAFRAGGVGFSWIESHLRDQDLSSLFCSEYVCAAHVAVGVFKSDDVSRWNPARLVRAERSQGILARPIRLK